MVLLERLQQASTRTNERWKIIVTWAPDGSKEVTLSNNTLSRATAEVWHHPIDEDELKMKSYNS
ncbi:cell wall glucanase [Aspergillus luchuensis]|uniref:Cell wall glucanase n=1 Tax=Aspergillus kawachii TaxID=1069201 RepID=A0A146F1H3_ASPKA|nr:cell wall glucanase [Aspergillus luchuensis]